MEGRGGDVAAECVRTDATQSIENRVGFQGRKLLEVAGEFEKQWLIFDCGDELQADRQAVFCKAAGNGDGRDAGEVRRTIQAQQKSACGVKRSVDEGGFFADEWGGDGRGGDDESVNVRILQGLMKRSDELFAHLQGS